MKKLFLLILIALALVLCQSETRANKIMASDLTWTFIGQDSFLIKLVVYRDCNGDVLNSTPIIFTNTQTGIEIKRLNLGVGTPVDITPVCNEVCTRCQSPSCTFPYGIHRYTMQGIIRLDGAGSCCSVKISWQQCCRNLAITTGGAGTDFYTEATMNRCQNPGDNSPTFTGFPIGIICIGQDLTFDQGVCDIDVNNTGGLTDSITYEWVQPLSAANTPISYSGGYSYNKPIYFWGFPNADLPLPWGIILDPQSGSIQFRPMKAEITIMVIKVNEFRNGIKIAELMRNIQFIVMTCPTNHPPGITTQNNIRAKSVCAGDIVSFDFFSNDSDVDDSVKLSWNNAIPGAIWTHTNGLSKYPTGTLTWYPTDAHVRSLPYTFTVTAKDDFCPIRGTFTQTYQITVIPRPQANIIITDSCCNTFWLIAQRIQGSGPTYLWQGENFVFQPNTGSVVWHKFTQPGIYPFTMTMTASGCSKTYYDTIIADTLSDIIENPFSKSDFKIYPNPASDYVNIVYQGYSKWEGRLLVFDPNSKLVTNLQLDFNKAKPSFVLPINGYKPGMYLLKLENTSGTILLKLLIQ